MKNIYEQADQLARDAEEIAISLFLYNTATRSLGCKKDSLESIQHDVAMIMQRYSRIYAEIGEKIKNEN